VSRFELTRAGAVSLRGRLREGPSDMLKGPVPVAGEMVLQVAAQDIGQLTDLQARRASAGAVKDAAAGRGLPWAGRAHRPGEDHDLRGSAY